MANEKNYKKRDAILSYLRQTHTHPSAEMVYGEVKNQIPDISMATVYRNLATFRQRGDIVCVGTVNGMERYDGNTHPHVHFICEGCHKVLDMPGISLSEQVYNQARDLYGYTANYCNLTINGLCDQCTANKKGENIA